MSNETKLNPELLQPEDVVKTKRARKSKVKKAESVSEDQGTVKYSHPEYDMYMSYQKYFEQQQKSILEYWTTVLRNIWNIPK